MVVRSRKGFTLIELLVALVLLLMVSAAFWSALATVQRTTRTQTEMAAMRGTLRGGIQIVSSELQELYANSAGESDIIAMNATTLRYKAMRGSGVACAATYTQITIRRDHWAGLQSPGQDLAAGLFIFADGEQDDDGDDAWLEVAITGPVVPSTCGADPAWAVPVNITDPAEQALLDNVTAESPVRTYEEMELGLVTDGGRSWLGLRSVTQSEATLLPLAGPLATNGVTFTYHQDDGSPTSTAADVALIKLLLIGQTDRAVNQGVSSTVQTVDNPMTLQIQLRNSR